jgi:hypothetical protein
MPLNVMDFRLNGMRIPSRANISLILPEKRIFGVYYVTIGNPDGCMNNTALIEQLASNKSKNDHGAQFSRNDETRFISFRYYLLISTNTRSELDN